MAQDLSSGLSHAEMDRLLSLGSGDAALLYMYARRQGMTASPGAMPGFSPERLKQADGLLCQAGLYSSAPVPAASAVQDVLSNPDFTNIVQETEQLLGKTLSSQDLQTLCAIYKHGFPPGVMLLLIHYCISQQQRRSPDRKPSLRQIEKEAAIWQQEDLFTEELAEAYIDRRERLQKASSETFRSLGIFGREPTATEKKYVNEWLSLGFDHDAIALAYDKTVVNTGKLVWKYCDTIIRRWHSEKLHTVSEIEARESKGKSAVPIAQNREKAGLAHNQELLSRIIRN